LNALLKLINLPLIMH